VAWEPQPAAEVPPSPRARAVQEDPGVCPYDEPAASAVGLAFEMASEQDHAAAFQEALDKEELENRAVRTIVSFFRRLRFKLLPGSPAKQGGAAVWSEREQFVAQWRQWDQQQRLARFAQCFEQTTAHGLAWFAGTRLLFSQQQLGAACFESTKTRMRVFADFYETSIAPVLIRGDQVVDQMQVRIQNLLGDEVCNQLNHDINLLRLICARLHAHLEQADQSLWEVSSQQLLDLNQEIFNLQTCIQNSERLVATSHGPWLMAEHQHQQEMWQHEMLRQEQQHHHFFPAWSPPGSTDHRGLWTPDQLSQQQQYGHSYNFQHELLSSKIPGPPATNLQQQYHQQQHYRQQQPPLWLGGGPHHMMQELPTVTHQDDIFEDQEDLTEELQEGWTYGHVHAGTRGHPSGGGGKGGGGRGRGVRRHGKGHGRRGKHKGGVKPAAAST